jgi:DNA-binding transcriptional LysR family regulator
MDWDKLRIFHAVAAAGSFTHAGQMLSLSQSAVSRQIGALEEELTTPLFQRHARGLTLTDEGEMLYSAVSDVLGRLAQAEEALKNVRETPRGHLKVTVSHDIGNYWLVPRLAHFFKECPEIELHIVMEDHELDLAQREADIAIRMRAPVQADLIQRKLFTVHYHAYAASDYLAARGTPDCLNDLAGHTIIAYGETVAPEMRDVNWLVEQARRLPRGGACPQLLRINNVTGVLRAVQAGLGFAAVPDYMAALNPELVRILPDLPSPPSFDVHLVYADSLRQSKRVAAFRNFLVREAKSWCY